MTLQIPPAPPTQRRAPFGRTWEKLVYGLGAIAFPSLLLIALGATGKLAGNDGLLAILAFVAGSVSIGLRFFWLKWRKHKAVLHRTQHGMNIFSDKPLHWPAATQEIERAITESIEACLEVRPVGNLKPLWERLYDGEVKIRPHLLAMVGWVDKNGNRIPDKEDENVAVELAHFRDIEVACRPGIDSLETVIARVKHGIGHICLDVFGVPPTQHHELMREAKIL